MLGPFNTVDDKGILWKIYFLTIQEHEASFLK